MKKALVILASTLLATLATTGTASAAPKGVSVDQYCKTTYGSGFKQHLAAEKTAYSWSCRRDDGNSNYTNRRVDMLQACRQQHGVGYDAAFRPAVEVPAYGWQCIKRELSINVQKYCKDTYGATARLESPEKRSGDWRCIEGSGSETIARGLNMNKVCAAQYGSSLWRAFNRFNQAGDGYRPGGAYQWYCATH